MAKMSNSFMKTKTICDRRCVVASIISRGYANESKDKWVSLYGANGSPYTRKVMSALRYKQIPFTFHHLMPGNLMGDWEEKGLGHIKPKVIPVIKYADGESQNDSTFIFEKLDSIYQSRPIIPKDPKTAFLALLLEDMFDEWGTKIMFGMRWLKPVDQKWSARYLLYDGQLGKGQPLKELHEFGDQFGQRQMERMKIVGCDNAEMVEKSFSSIIGALENHLQQGSFFLLGDSPTIADFALYGQLSQLVIDRTSDELIRDNYPAVWTWIRLFEDLSGVDGDSYCENQKFLEEMLKFAAQVYLPFLEANSSSVLENKPTTEVVLWQNCETPQNHSQPTFKYQHKCFLRIKQTYQQLEEKEKDVLNELLISTNALKYLI